MKKFVNILFIASILFLYWGCSEVENWDIPTDNTPPGSVSNPIVENFHGGAKISYTLPSDNDLLGVKAVFTFGGEGKENEVFSSAFTDTIVVEGFPDTSERTVKLICLDQSKNESPPVEVKVQPLKPPVEMIMQTLEIKTTFGGAYVSWENIYKENIGISLFAADSTGELVHNYTYFSNEVEGQYAFRGFDDTEREFRIHIRDNWDRFSTPLDTILKPLFERQLFGFDESGPVWERYGYDDGTVKWRGDLPKNYPNPNQQFDNVYDQNYGGMWHTGRPGNMLIDFTGNAEDKDVELIPMYFIIDLGDSYNLSRHKMWHRDRFPCAFLSPKYYEIWATNETPKGPDDFSNQMESLAYWTSWPEVGGTDTWKNGWTKIAYCECIPPSGARTEAEVTEEDKQHVKNYGFEFEIDLEDTGKPFRYVRFICQPTWSPGTNMQIAEIEFFGSSANE